MANKLVTKHYLEWSKQINNNNYNYNNQIFKAKFIKNERQIWVI